MGQDLGIGGGFGGGGGGGGGGGMWDGVGGGGGRVESNLSTIGFLEDDDEMLWWVKTLGWEGWKATQEKGEGKRGGGKRRKAE